MRAFLFLVVFLLGSAVFAADDLAEARALFEARRYPEAKVALEKIVAAEPKNAAVCMARPRARVAQRCRRP